MTVLGLAGAVVGLASGIFGASRQRKAAREQRRELARQRAAVEAWYNRNYYQDYLNTVRGRNAIKKVRDAWAEQIQEARARQAVSGGTPEGAAAVAEAGGEALGDVVGNIAAQGEQNRAAIDAQKLAMDTNLSQQEMAIAEAEQQAGANLMNSGIGVATSALQGIELNGTVKPPMIVKEVGLKPAMGVPAPPEVELPKKIKPLNL